MRAGARPRSIRFTDDELPSENAAPTTGDEKDEDQGPLSPNLKLPAASVSSSRSDGPGGAPNSAQTSGPECTLRRPLEEVQPLEQRLRAMAMLHAKTTAQLLQAQKERFEADGRALREEAEFELLELRQDLELKQAQCVSLQRALDTEVAAWASRCAASEARTSALYAGRASLAAEIHRLRLEADAAREGARREVEACTRRGEDQLDNLGRLFLASTTSVRGAGPRTPVKPTVMDAGLGTTAPRTTPPLNRRMG